MMLVKQFLRGNAGIHIRLILVRVNLFDESRVNCLQSVMMYLDAGMLETFSYPVIILGALLANVAPWLGFSMIWFELIINNAMHTILFQPTKPVYNPGLITNSFLLLPFGMITLLVATGSFTWLDWVLSLILGVGLSAALGMKTRGRLAKLKTSSASDTGAA